MTLDPNATQRSIPAIVPTPHMSATENTDRLCTICNRILLHVRGSTVCICKNSHVHSYPEFEYLGV